MPREQIPVTPAVVRWARERAGYTTEAAQQRFAKISEWEEATSSPTYPQLEAMADTFKVPIAVFFFPEPPDVPPIEETFRTLPDVEIARLAPRIKLLLRKAKALQIALAELNNGQNPLDRQITRDIRSNPDIEPRELATIVRRYLNVSVEEQSSWADTDEALKQWRNRLTSVGVYVFKDKFQTDGFAGFCLTDQTFPVIYVNNTAAKARQIFTLFHELAHLLFHTSGIDTDADTYVDRLAGDARRVEIFCNQFAGTFLVPQDALAAALRGQAVTPEFVRDLSRQFHVSQLVVWRRLLDSRRIDRATYEDAQRRGADGAPYRPRPGGDYYNTQLAYLGRHFVALALSQYHQRRITTEQVADYLDVKPKNLAKLEERFLRGAA